MTFNRLNNIVGWIVCLIACTVYVLTMEPTGSLWDCGEFVSSAYKLQVPHPPGAPLFTLLGRFFIILFGDDPMTAAKAVNFMSAIASGFTILFLFWTITHFARKMVQKPGADLKGEQLFGVMAAGTIGALAYTFSDSFWYSAVEGEVYALSSLFTAVVFWAILKWEHEVDLENKADKHMFSSADRWIVFIFFMMGLSIGVHLLNLLTIPAIVMVYYFKRYKVTKWGLLWAFLIGCLITGIVQVAIIQWSIKGAGAFDIFFVNKIGTPFFVGFIIYFLLLFGLLVGGLRYNAAAIKKFSSFPIWLSLLILLFCFPLIDSVGGFLGFLVIIGSLIFVCYNYKDSIGSFVQIALFSTIFMILGYSTYFSTLIRSTANPSVDMYNVDNPVTLVGYLSREQYGETPLFYGPDFIYRPPSKDAGDLYVKGKDKYNVVGKIRKQDFAAKPSEQEIDEIIRQHPDWDASKIGPHIFPRMFDNSNERSQEYVYRNFGGMEQGEQPTFKNNIQYFLNYQLRWMYWRYFMWNFAGKQNDLQGLGNIRDGNWASGIDFIDKNIFNTSPASDLPDTAGKNNKANNKLFLLPLLLGLLGFYYQYKRTSNDFLVTFLLFFFTGIAIVVYLNQSGFQPRERDYAFVGSFYAFAIWIGLGLLWVKDILAKAVNASVAGIIAFPLCLVAVPVWMGIQEWDDHDRSKKTLAFDLGKDYLESCEKDAIVISFGDNDTYPLWYTLEVAGVRKDLRVMNYSLLGTDWYVNQLRYKVNGSAPVDVIFTPEQIEGGTRDAVFTASYLNRVNFPNNPISYFDQNTYYDLYKMLKEVTGSEDPRYKVPVGDDEYMYSFPVTKVSVPVDLETVSKTIPLNPGEQFVPELRLDIKKSFLQKNDLAILALIATNQWKRPIYFTSTQELEQLGLDKYVRLEGMSYRLVPVQGSSAQNDIAYRNIMEKFGYGSADKKGVYFDEENRRHLNSIRQSQSIIALNLAQQNKKDSARKILRKYDQMVREENMPYGFTSNRGNFHNRISLTFLYAAYESNDKELARKVSASIKKDLEQQLKYYRSLGSESLSNEELANQASAYLRQQPSSLSDDQVIFAQDIESSNSMLRQMQDLEKQYGAAPEQSNKESGSTTLPAPGTPK